MTLTDTELNSMLDQWVVPEHDGLNDRIFARAMREKAPRVWVMFLRHCTWLSIAFMVGGFCFGKYASAADYQHAADYFDTLFTYGVF